MGKNVMETIPFLNVSFALNVRLRKPVHLQKAIKSIVWHNTRKAEFTPPSMFKMRKSSPYVMSPITNKDINQTFTF